LRGLHLTDTLKQRYPDSAQSYFLQAAAAANLARIKKGMNRIAPARMVEENIKKALALDPLYAPAYVILGGYYREVAVANPMLKALVRIFFKWSLQGTLKGSETELNKALELSPNNTYALLELARTCIASGNRKKAVGILTEMQNIRAVWHFDNRLKLEGRELLMQLKN
jgi:Tfp pilus assembly protein PilF